jgi:hypothetical protein
MINGGFPPIALNARTGLFRAVGDELFGFLEYLKGLRNFILLCSSIHVMRSAVRQVRTILQAF